MIHCKKQGNKRELYSELSGISVSDEDKRDNIKTEGYKACP